MQALDEALDGVRQALEADGYRLEVDPVRSGVLGLTIIATPGACEECLVPKDIMKAIIQQALRPEMGIREIELRYPKDTY